MNTQLPGPKHARADIGRAHRGRALLAAAAASLVALTGLSGVALASDENETPTPSTSASSPQTGATEGAASDETQPTGHAGTISSGTAGGSSAAPEESASANAPAATADTDVAAAGGSEAATPSKTPTSIQMQQVPVEPYAAGDVTIGTVTAQMANFRGAKADGTPDTTWSARCIRFAPSSGTGSSATSSAWVTSAGEAQTAHGNSSSDSCPRNLSTSSQSALGFTPTALTSIAPGSEILLGTMKHYNNPVYDNGLYFWGDLNIEIADVTLTYRWRLYETTNTTNPCAFADEPVGINDNGCADQVMFGNTVSSQVITDPTTGLKYTLQIHGFTNNGSNGTCPATPTGAVVNQWLTKESTKTNGCLYGTLVQVRPLTIVKQANSSASPTTIPGFGFSSTSSLSDSAWSGKNLTLQPTALGSSGAIASAAANVLSGETVAITETAPSNWSLSSVACVDGAGNALAGVTSDVTSRKVTLASIPSASSATALPITCTFTNTESTGGAVWAKQDAATGALVAGSEWTLTGPTGPTGPGSTVRAVTDCVGVGISSCDGLVDKDSRLGRFSVQNLPWGEYKLVETKAPPGYELYSATIPPLTISGSVKTIDFKNLPNTRIADATVTIAKKVLDVDGGNPESAGGWQVGAKLSEGGTAGTSITTPDTQTTDSSGSAPTGWFVTFPSTSATVDVIVSERQQVGYSFSSATCTVTPTTGTVRNVMLNGVTGVVAGVKSGDAVSCQFTNQPQAGSVQWSKVAAGTSNLLSGSEWTLKGPGAGGELIPVTDCVRADMSCPGPDLDPAAGRFKVSGLGWGSYILTETKAPAGFVVSSGSPWTFNIGVSDGAVGVLGTYDLGSIENKQRQAVTLPLTGGLGTDTFLLAGGGLLALAGIGGWIHRRRSLRVQRA